MIRSLEKEKQMLQGQIRDIEWRLDQESKVRGLFWFDLELWLSSWTRTVCNARKSVSMVTQEVESSHIKLFLVICDLASVKYMCVCDIIYIYIQSMLKLKQTFQVDVLCMLCIRTVFLFCFRLCVH